MRACAIPRRAVQAARKQIVLVSPLAEHMPEAVPAETMVRPPSTTLLTPVRYCAPTIDETNRSC